MRENGHFRGPFTTATMIRYVPQSTTVVFKRRHHRSIEHGLGRVTILTEGAPSLIASGSVSTR